MIPKWLDAELRDWSASIMKEIEMSGFSKETITYKLMRCGTMVRSTVIPVPGYWPTANLIRLNDIVWSLPVEERNMVVMRRILDYSYNEIGKEYGLSKGGVFKKLDRIEQKIGCLLNE